MDTAILVEIGGYTGNISIEGEIIRYLFDKNKPLKRFRGVDKICFETCESIVWICAH